MSTVAFTGVQAKEMRTRKKAIKKRKRRLASDYKKVDEFDKRLISVEWIQLDQELGDVKYELVTHRNEMLVLAWRLYAFMAPFLLAFVILGLLSAMAIYGPFPE